VNLGKHCTHAGLRVVDRPTGDTRQTAEDQVDMDGLGIALLPTGRSCPHRWGLEDVVTVLHHLDR